jgi:hypothetical protein
METLPIQGIGVSDGLAIGIGKYLSYDGVTISEDPCADVTKE